MGESDETFGGPVYRPRRRRGPLAKLGLAAFYLSSLLPAVWIAWRFDLVNRMGERLKEEPAARVDDRGPAPPAPNSPEAPLPDLQAANESDAMSADAALQETSSDSLAAGDPSVVGVANREPARTEPALAHTIDLDLSGRRQRIPLKHGGGKRFRVAKVEQCPAEYEMVPSDGVIGPRSTTTIVVSGRRDVELRISHESNSLGESLVVEPVVKTDDGQEIPFNLQGMDRLRRRTQKQAADADGRLAEMRAEQERLAAWIAAPIVKPLATVGQAKARVAALEVEIVRQAALAGSLRANAEVAADMERLARQLHARCQVGLAEAE